MLQVIFITILIVGISFILLGLNIIFRKNGKFPNIHIGGNKELAKRGIHCATTQDRLEQRSNHIGSRSYKTMMDQLVDDQSC